MDRQPVLHGDRLLLRPLTRGDWDALYAVASDPLIWELHPAHDRWQEEVFRRFFDDALANGGALAFVDMHNAVIVGSSRYQGFDPDNGASVEVGWTFLARSHWGGSYNREMKRLMLAHAFRFVERVTFMVGADNQRSRRAMAKIGGRLTDYRKVRWTAGLEVPQVCFEITRDSLSAGPSGA
jgi:RimJ/RimL family protein N-acetyltransferase